MIGNLLPSHFDKIPQIQKQIYSLSLALDNTRSVNLDVHNLRISLTKTLLSAKGDSASLDVLQSRYPSSPLRPLLPLLACPIEHAITMFVDLHPNGFKSVPTLDESSLFDEIVHYVDK